MNSILKYLLILPNLLLLIVAGFSQTKSTKAVSRDHTDALSRIYAEITSEEERAELAAENPDEIFLTGTEEFESALSEKLAETQTEELPFGDIVKNDENNKTADNIASPEIEQVKEFKNLKKPIEKDLSKTTIANAETPIKSVAPKVVVPTQPVSEPTSVESTIVVSMPSRSNNSSSPTYVELKVVRPVTTYIDSNIATTTTTTIKNSKKSINRSSSKTYVEYSSGSKPTFGSGKYQIQLGYFESAGAANQLAEQLKSRYYEPVTIAEDSSKGTVSYRVLLGDYEKVSDAQILFRTLRNNGAEATIMMY